MWAAFVYGIAATSVIATSPCAHHSVIAQHLQRAVSPSAGEGLRDEPAGGRVVELPGWSIAIRTPSST